jgi:hypothetical protein
MMAEGLRLKVDMRKWITSDDWPKEFVDACAKIGARARERLDAEREAEVKFVLSSDFSQLLFHQAQRAVDRFVKRSEQLAVWGPFWGEPSPWAETREVYR